MKTKLTYFTIFAILLVIVIGLSFRGSATSSLGHEQIDMLIGDGMPQNRMTPQPYSTGDFDELMDFNELIDLIETTMEDEWIAIGGPKHKVKTNDLIEVDESDGDFALRMQLFWRDQQLATEWRYFVLYGGPDGEIEERPAMFLGCAMFSNGFLSGKCEFEEVSSTHVAVAPDWTFDDRDHNVESNFNQSFIAKLDDSGIVDCGNDATLRWRFEAKTTEQ